MIISILAFSIVANYGIDFIVETVSESFNKKEDNNESVDDNTGDNDLKTEDLSVTGTYSFAVFVTQNTYVPDYVPAFNGYSYESIMETYNIQYSQIIRYVIVATIDAANRQMLINTMSGNFLVTYNDVEVPIDYIYYLIRTGSNDLDYTFLANIAGTYSGLFIENYFFTNIDRFCDVTNYTGKTEINVPEKFTGTHPFTNEKIKVSSGKQPLTYDLLHMTMSYDSYLSYEGICRSTSDVFATYLKAILNKSNASSVNSLIKRLSQKSTTDLTLDSISEKLDLIFSAYDFESYSVVPTATLKKYGNEFFYKININESITNIKKYYNKASS